MQYNYSVSSDKVNIETAKLSITLKKKIDKLATVSSLKRIIMFSLILAQFETFPFRLEYQNEK